MSVRFSLDADADLEAIASFIALHNPTRALTFAREIAQAAIDLGDSPLAYPVLRGREADPLRRKVHGSYLIIYRVTDGEVEIVRILHGARDVSRILGSDDA